MRRINIALNVKSIDKAIAQIEERSSKLDVECKTLAERLSRYGMYVARVGFANAIYEGKNDTALEVIEVQNGYEVHAKGKAVCFIEFGTGVGATSPHGAQFGFNPDSWSKDNAQMFHNFGYWFYNGKKLTGTPANNCMYNASREIKEQIKVFAKEVFK